MLIGLRFTRMKTVRSFPLLLAIVLVICDTGAATGLTHGKTCTATDGCEQNKNLECRKPFPDCNKGHCLCSDDAVEWRTEGCVLEYRTNSQTCDVTKGHMCQDVAGLECTAGTCGCPQGEEWDDTKKLCKDNTNVKVVAADPVTCADNQKCRAASGKVKSKTCSSTEKYLCAEGYKFKDNGCVKTKGNFGSTCSVTADCATSFLLMIGGGEKTVDTNTNYKCGTTCKCADATPIQMRMLHGQDVCKASGGLMEEAGECTVSKDCSGTLVCGKCPEDSDDSKKKCHKDYTRKPEDVCVKNEDCLGGGLECLKPFPGCQKGYCFCKSTHEFKKDTNKCTEKKTETCAKTSDGCPCSGFYVDGETCKKKKAAAVACNDTKECQDSIAFPVDGLSSSTQVNTGLSCTQQKCSCGNSQTLVSLFATEGKICKANGPTLFLKPCSKSNECSDTMVCGVCPEDEQATRCQKSTSSDVTYKSNYLGACRTTSDCAIGECTNPASLYGVCTCPDDKPFYIDKKCQNTSNGSKIQVTCMSSVLGFLVVGFIQFMTL